MSLKIYLVLGLAAATAKAQTPMKEINIYSVDTCGGDPNDLDILTTTLTVWPNSNEDIKSGTCMEARVGLPGWPRTDGGQGRYNIWVNGEDIDDDCYLWFYDFRGPEEEKYSDASCLQPYRRVSKKQPCADLEVTANFGYAYCCGNCDESDPNMWTKRDQILARNEVATTKEVPATKQVPATKDVTAIKRAPLLNRINSRNGNTKGDECRWVKDEDAYTTYGPAKRMSSNDHCQLDQTTCGQAWTYTTGVEITNGWNIQVSVSIDFFKIVSGELSGGYEHSETDVTEFSVTKQTAPEPGHEGYATFAPLYRCGKGHIEGDCSMFDLFKLGDDPFCVNVMLEGNIPRGSWRTVIID